VGAFGRLHQLRALWLFRRLLSLAGLLSQLGLRGRNTGLACASVGPFCGFRLLSLGYGLAGCFGFDIGVFIVFAPLAVITASRHPSLWSGADASEFCGKRGKAMGRR
jgi:hypothetical protein